MSEHIRDPRDVGDGEDKHIEEVTIEDIDISIEALWRVFAEINEWTRAADFKASVVLAADGGVIIAMSSLAVGDGGFSAMLLARHPVGIFFLLTLACVILSAVFAALCLVPPLHEGEVESVLFMGYISEHFPTAQSYEDAVRVTLIDADNNLRQISHQVWSVAKIYAKKVSYALWGIRFLVAALVCLLLSLLFAYL